MIKKIFKLCVFAGITASFTPSGIAASLKTDVSGFGWGYFHSYSYKANSKADGYTQQEFGNQGRLGIKVTVTEGDWKTGGKVEYDIKNDGETFSGRDQMAYIQYKNIYMGMGRIDFGDITKGGDFYTDKFKIDQLTVGETCTYDDDISECRMDSLVIAMKDLGLSFRWGQDHYSADGATDYTYDIDTNADGTADSTKSVKKSGKYKEQVLSLMYETSYGALDLAAEYHNITTIVDEDLDADLKDTEYDGAKASSYAVAVKYKINDMVSVATNIEISTRQSGVSGADKLGSSIIIAGADLSLDEKSGVSASYAMQTSELTKDDKETLNSLVTSYRRKIAGTVVYAQYASHNYNSDVDAEESSSSKDGRKASEIALGLMYKF